MSSMSPVEAVRRRWWIVAGFAVLGALMAALPEPQNVADQATSFSATHTMLANDSGDSTIVSPSQVVLLATAGEVPQRVVDATGLEATATELAAQVDVSFDVESGSLTFTTTQETPERAEVVANAFADELNSYLTERQSTVYEDRLSKSRAHVQDLQTQLSDLTKALATSPEDALLLAQQDAVSRQYGLAFEQNSKLEVDPGILTFTTLQRAEARPVIARGLGAPVSRPTRAVMGFVVGAALGLAVALILARVDRKIRSREQAEDIVAMRARVAIPRVRTTTGGIIVSAGRHDPLSDAYRTVRNVVGFVQTGVDIGTRAYVTLVVSPGPGDGKTSLASNLAAAFLERGNRVIAVNTDFRRPRLHEAIMGTPTPETPFDLDELDAVPRRAIPLDTTADNMKILDLSTVPGSPGQLVRATVRQIERMSDVADQIVIDTSPVGATAEVLDLVPLADVIVLVVRVGHTSVDATEQTISILRDIADAPIVFVVGGIKVGRNPYHEYTDHRWTSHPKAGQQPAGSARPEAAGSATG